MICTYCISSLCLVTGLLSSFLHLSNSQHFEILAGPNSQTWHVDLINQELACVVIRGYGIAIKWVKDGMYVSEDEHISIANDSLEDDKVISTLIFHNLTKSDEGSYQCNASTVTESIASQRAIIEISGPPVVNPLPSSLSVQWRDQLALLCDGRGPPDIISVQWTYKALVRGIDQPSIAFRGVIISYEMDPFLWFLPREDDAIRLGVTEYEVFCTVRNKYGSCNSRAATIFIKQRPQTPVVDHVSIVDDGKEIKLFWKITSRPVDVDACVAYFNGSERMITLTRPYNSIQNEQFVNGLIPESSYSVRIRCANAVGESNYSVDYTFTAESDAPSNFLMEALNTTSLRLSWDPIPSHLFHELLKGYRIKLRNTEGAKISRDVASDENATDFYELIPGETYAADVRGFTSSTEGPCSIMKYATLPISEDISKPIMTVSDISEKGAIFHIQDVNDNEGALRNCSLSMSDGTHHVTVGVELSQNVTLELKANTAYTVKVKCYIYGVTEMCSDTATFRTSEGAPGFAPENLDVTTSNQSFLVKWSPVSTDLNGNFTSYNVCKIATDKKARDDNVCVKSANTSYTFPNVQTDATWTVLVSACTKAGCGPSRAFRLVATNVLINSVSRKEPTEEGLLIFIYAPVIVLLAAITIGAAVYRKRLKNSNKSNKARPTPNHTLCEPQQTNDERPCEGPLLRPTEAAITYSDRCPSPYPALSQKTSVKLASIKYDCDHVNLKAIIGKGEFGRVYKAEFSLSKRLDGATDVDVVQVAVKTMIMQVYEQGEYEEFVREGLRMKDMNHPNVMRLLGICLPVESNVTTDNLQSAVHLSSLDALSPWIIVPYMPNGDLKQYFFKARMNEKKIEMEQILQFSHDIACGMEYLTEKKIIHRDLACRNCMLNGNMNVVISDFGLSRQVYSRTYYRQSHVAKMPVKWMAIESLRYSLYTSMTDVWSFGVTVWELFTFCQSPFPGVNNHEMLELLEAGTRLNKPNFCPSEVWNNCIYPCWDPRSDERPLFSELVDMFAGYKSVYCLKAPESPQENLYVNVKPAGEQAKPKVYNICTL